jgi:small subunit ribosomal protein S2
MTKIPKIEEMLKAGMHFGHRTSKWHPKMQPFIFGERNGVHIIDLVKSQRMLEISLEFIKKLASEGKVILFVGTKPQAQTEIKRVAEAIGMPYVSGKWLGGCLTNFQIIKKSIRRYLDLVKKKETGELKKYTKKEQLDFDNEIEKLSFRVGGLVSLIKIPDAVFVWDIKNEATAVSEANRKNIPVIGVCDTNSNPSPINYVIPANDDASKTIKLVLAAVEEAVLEGKAETANKKA